MTIVPTSYGLLDGDRYVHGAVKHGDTEYAYYDYRTGETHHVNTVEAFWKLFKHSARSTRIHISEKYTQRYLDEFTFRSNHREMESEMFDLPIGAV